MRWKLPVAERGLLFLKYKCDDIVEVLPLNLKFIADLFHENLQNIGPLHEPIDVRFHSRMERMFQKHLLCELEIQHLPTLVGRPGA